MPPAVAAGLALQAVCLAQLHRWLTEPRHFDRMEAAFNIGQTSLYVLLGGLAFAATPQIRISLPQNVTLPAALLPLAVAAVAMHVANTGLVAVASGLQLGVSPLRVWWRNFGLDLVPTITLSALGAVVALNASDRPILLAVLVLPLLLVQHTVRESTRLRTDTHRALATLVEVVELRDPYTAGHSRRVAATGPGPGAAARA